MKASKGTCSRISCKRRWPIVILNGCGPKYTLIFSDIFFCEASDRFGFTWPVDGRRGEARISRAGVSVSLAHRTPRHPWKHLVRPVSSDSATSPRRSAAPVCIYLRASACIYPTNPSYGESAMTTGGRWHDFWGRRLQSTVTPCRPFRTGGFQLATTNGQISLG